MRSTSQKFVLVVATFAAIFTLLASGDKTGGDSKSNKSEAGAGAGAAEGGGPSDDVKIATCATDSLGQLSASLKITNQSSKASSYFVTVVFESTDGSTQLDSTIASATNLEPNQNTTVDAVSFTDAPGGFKCRVTDVTRFAS